MIKLKPGFHMIDTIAVIAAIVEKKKKLQRSQRSYETTLQQWQRQQSHRSFSLRSLESGFHMIAELFFLSDHSDRSDHMETGLNHPPFLLNCYPYALQTYRTHSPKLRLLLVWIKNAGRQIKFANPTCTCFTVDQHSFIVYSLRIPRQRTGASYYVRV